MLEPGQFGAGLEHDGQEGLLDDHHPRPRVVHQIADLAGGIGRVDREGCRPDRHGGQVGDVELGPVAEHQGDRVPAADAQAGEAAGERVDPLQELGPGQRDAVVGRAHGDDLRMIGGCAPQRLGQRRRVHCPPGAGRDGAALHGFQTLSPVNRWSRTVSNRTQG